MTLVNYFSKNPKLVIIKLIICITKFLLLVYVKN